VVEEAGLVAGADVRLALVHVEDGAEDGLGVGGVRVAVGAVLGAVAALLVVGLEE